MRAARARRLPRFSRLPRRGYLVREKHLRRFRALWRQLTDAPGASETTFDGLLHMGDDGNEIWVEATLSEPEKHFTIVHELVHARRQRAGEDLDDEREEPIVEMETIARVSRRTLGRMPSGLALVVLHDYLTRQGRDNPTTRVGLAAVHRRILALLGGRRPAARAGGNRLAAHRRPFKRGRSGG